MKLKNFLLCTLSAVALLGVTASFTSCSNDDMGDDDGFTPITPNLMTMSNGDYFILYDSTTTTSDSGINYTYAQFNFFSADTSTVPNSSGTYTYSSSIKNSRTKTLVLSYGATGGEGSVTSQSRTIVIQFTSSVEAVVVSDTGYIYSGVTYTYDIGSDIDLVDTE